MKTNNISFPSINRTIDSKLIKAIEALPSYSFFSVPCVYGIECYMTENNIIVYPTHPKSTLYCVKLNDMRDYEEHLAFTSFKFNRFSYKFLKRNPINRYDSDYGRKK